MSLVFKVRAGSSFKVGNGENATWVRIERLTTKNVVLVIDAPAHVQVIRKDAKNQEPKEAATAVE